MSDIPLAAVSEGAASNDQQTLSFAEHKTQVFFHLWRIAKLATLAVPGDELLTSVEQAAWRDYQNAWAGLEKVRGASSC